MQLKRLLDTGRTCRIERGQAIRIGYVAITETLCHLVEVDASGERERYVEAELPTPGSITVILVGTNDFKKFSFWQNVYLKYFKQKVYI